MNKTSANGKRPLKKLSSREEEVRVVVVLGVIAALIAGRSYYETAEINFIAFKLPAITYANMIIVTWGAYSFFLVFALSKDIFPESVRNFAYLISIVTFLTGAFFTVYFILSFYLIGLYNNLLILIYPFIPYLLFHYIFLKPIHIPTIKNKFTKDNFYLFIAVSFMMLWILPFSAFFVNTFGTDISIFIPKYYIQFLPYISAFSSLIFIVLYVFINKKKLVE